MHGKNIPFYSLVSETVVMSLEAFLKVVENCLNFRVDYWVLFLVLDLSHPLRVPQQALVISSVLLILQVI